jgi:hypothetical protein
MRVSLLRAVGAATALYGLAVTARPELLARPSGLTGEEGETAWQTKLALRPLAWRDVASGLAMVLAPRGPALTTATLVRIASDAGDAVLLGRELPGRGGRWMTVATSAGWGAVSLAGLLAPAGECPCPTRRGVRRGGEAA